jgi:hypothetical protein
VQDPQPSNPNQAKNSQLVDPNAELEKQLEEWQMLLHKTDREATWEYFLLFNPIFVEGLVQKLLPGVQAVEKQYIEVRTRILELVRHFQSKTIDNGIVSQDKAWVKEFN